MKLFQNKKIKYLKYKKKKNFDSKSLRTESVSHYDSWLKIVISLLLRSFLQGMLKKNTLLIHFYALFNCI